MDQNCRRDRTEYQATEPNAYGFFNNDEYCYARDSHTAGYGKNSDKTVTHRRRVLFVKPAFWIVADDFVASDEREHTAEAQFLLDAESAEIDEQTKAAAGTGRRGRLAVIPLLTEGLSLRVARGETEPEVRGFLPEGFERLRPAPALLYTRRFVGNATVAYALVPFDGPKIPAHATGDILHVGDQSYRFEITGTRLAIQGAENSFDIEELVLGR
jgi:hypothetical protein